MLLLAQWMMCTESQYATSKSVCDRQGCSGCRSHTLSAGSTRTLTYSRCASNEHSIVTGVELYAKDGAYMQVYPQPVGSSSSYFPSCSQDSNACYF